VYLAAPLFSQAEREFNKCLAKRLEPRFEVFLPQRDGGLLVELIANGVDPRLARKRVCNADIAAIEKCWAFLIVLDGRCVDEGAALELGLAFAMHKVCIGLQTDPRRLLPIGNNPMIDAALLVTCASVEELVAKLEEMWDRQMNSAQASHNPLDR
jgi:nucleoside 2-deoxyribosyltransferase